jgi:uncharacterized SAM-binding protein YcdF (DUF218 family)
VENPFSFGTLALPTVFIILSLAGALIALAWRRAGIALALASSLALYLSATPALSEYLLRQVESGLPQDVDLAAAQAIVVLGADVRWGNGADIPDRLGPLSLERAVLAAEAYRRLHLPVLVSGGRERGAHSSEAALMKAVLEDDFGVPVAWTEEQSHTTWENAAYSARLLLPEQLATVVLVTHAWHLPRALLTFERVGLKAVYWPAPRTAPPPGGFRDYLPNLEALHDTFYALHEMIGTVYYRLRY